MLGIEFQQEPTSARWGGGTWGQTADSLEDYGALSRLGQHNPPFTHNNGGRVRTLYNGGLISSEHVPRKAIRSLSLLVIWQI